MTEAWPLVPLATREAPATEPGAKAREGAEGNPPTPSISPGRVDFGGVNGSSSSSSDDSRISSYSSKSNDSGGVVQRSGRAGIRRFRPVTKTAPSGDRTT